MSSPGEAASSAGSKARLGLRFNAGAAGMLVQAPGMKHSSVGALRTAGREVRPSNGDFKVTRTLAFTVLVAGLCAVSVASVTASDAVASNIAMASSPDIAVSAQEKKRKAQPSCKEQGHRSGLKGAEREAFEKKCLARTGRR